MNNEAYREGYMCKDAGIFSALKGAGGRLKSLAKPKIQQGMLPKDTLGQRIKTGAGKLVSSPLVQAPAAKMFGPQAAARIKPRPSAAKLPTNASALQNALHKVMYVASPQKAKQYKRYLQAAPTDISPSPMYGKLREVQEGIDPFMRTPLVAPKAIEAAHPDYLSKIRMYENLRRSILEGAAKRKKLTRYTGGIL